jgi:hypothetical protein
MAYSSWNAGRDALTYCGICIGLMFLFFGVVMWLFVGPLAGPPFELLFLGFSLAGACLFIGGLATLPGTRRRSKIIRRILEIAAVEKEVTISEIHTRTGIDSETVRAVLVHCLMNRILYGYIEDDLFVRDTSGGHFRYTDGSGLFNA